jgi:hypothetical protein
LTKKRHIIYCFLVFCLTATLLVGVTSSADYDPWCDINDDGLIDIVDLVNLAIRFGGEGTPINKTALLLKVNATFTQLLAEIDSLNASLKALKTGGFIGAPAWDSQWQPIVKGDTFFYHNQNTTDVVVYMMGKDSNGYIHQKFYGGDGNVAQIFGAYWYNLDEDSITVHRCGDDSIWVQVRIMIWKILPIP